MAQLPQFTASETVLGLVRSNQPNNRPRYTTELDPNAASTPTSTWKAKIKLRLQRDAFGDNCTKETFQL